MVKSEAKKRIEKLRELIDHHRYLYHVLDKQEISDEALDSLKKELFDLEQAFPDLITPDSPTQRVGGEPLKEFKKIKHKERMLSLNDTFSEEDMQDWFLRISKLLSGKEVNALDFYCELKLDGLAIELVYEKGILKTGSTRGDGSIGEDVTQNIKTVEAIPLNIKTDKEEVIVRGEVFLKKKEFEQINKTQEKKGLPIYANPRNIAAGSIRQLDPKITASRHLESNAYDLLTGFDYNTHEEKHEILKKLGFKINQNNKYCKNLKEVFEFHQYWKNNREKLPYEIDGIVVVINNNQIFDKLGVIGKTPRGAVAFKFPLRQSTTQIEDIVVQVGRTGAMTPVAHLKPVSIGGTIITRATLHNEDEIKRLGVKIGDSVIVGRAGDVIPDIIKVLPELRTGKEKEFKMPKLCPSCGTKIVKEGVLWRCPNPDCFVRQRRSIYHFVSRIAFNMVGLGPKIINKLLEVGLIQTPADLFNLKEGDIIPLERFAEKSAKNLIESIQEAKTVPLSRFIYSLGIRNVGEETALDLANKFSSIDNLESASFEELETIQDVGPVVAKSIVEWFKVNKKLVRDLLKAGVKIEHKKTLQKLDGLTFVFTGEMVNTTRERAKEVARSLGANVSESVSKNTSYLVAGDNPGSKFAKAKTLGVKVIGEEGFWILVNK